MKLYFAPGGASMVVHAALEEIGRPYELRLVDLAREEQKSPEFLELNPNGRVPVLLDGPVAMYESAAIVMYLADRYPDAGLAPHREPARSRYFLWMLVLSNTVEEALLRWYHPDDYVDGDDHRTALRHAATAKLSELWRRIDAMLEVDGYLTGRVPCAADLMLFMLCFWARRLPMPPSRWPHIATWLQDIGERPSVRAMMEREELAWGFAS